MTGKEGDGAPAAQRQPLLAPREKLRKPQKNKEDGIKENRRVPLAVSTEEGCGERGVISTGGKSFI